MQVNWVEIRLFRRHYKFTTHPYTFLYVIKFHFISNQHLKSKGQEKFFTKTRGGK